MTFNLDMLLYTLPFMAKGMLGIFIVTAVLMLIMYLLQKLHDKDGSASK
ncbi:MAG: hypothetical protein RR998_05670 [Oscillospiraceae bacterium]